AAWVLSRRDAAQPHGPCSRPLARRRPLSGGLPRARKAPDPERCPTRAEGRIILLRLILHWVATKYHWCWAERPIAWRGGTPPSPRDVSVPSRWQGARLGLRGRVTPVLSGFKAGVPSGLSVGVRG